MPGMSGNSLSKLLSSITFRLKRTFWFMMVLAQAARQFQIVTVLLFRGDRASRGFSPDPVSFNDEARAVEVRELGEHNPVALLGEHQLAQVGL